MNDRKDFLEKQKAQIAEWNKRIEDLIMMGKKARVEASVKIENYIEDLKERLEDMRLKVEEIKKAGDSGWQDLRGGMENAWRDMADAFEKAKSRFQ